jgi:hypothetical protein
MSIGRYRRSNRGNPLCRVSGRIVGKPFLARSGKGSPLFAHYVHIERLLAFAILLALRRCSGTAEGNGGIRLYSHRSADMGLTRVARRGRNVARQYGHGGQARTCSAIGERVQSRNTCDEAAQQPQKLSSPSVWPLQSLPLPRIY